MPQKKRLRKKTKTEVDKFNKCVIFNEFHITKGQHSMEFATAEFN
jgi:hypothetical protein